MDDVYMPSLDSVEAGAPAREIEITPEMVNEGVRLLMNYEPAFSNERDIAVMIINIGLMANRNVLENAR
jgi:hypothetical protein